MPENNTGEDTIGPAPHPSFAASGKPATWLPLEKHLRTSWPAQVTYGIPAEQGWVRSILQGNNGQRRRTSADP